MDTSSAASIIRLFGSDSTKVKAVQDLCPYIWDRKQNAEIIVANFTFASDKGRARDYLLKN